MPGCRNGKSSRKSRALAMSEQQQPHIQDSTTTAGCPKNLWGHGWKRLDGLGGSTLQQWQFCHQARDACSDLHTPRCTASCNRCVNVVVPASTPFAIAPGLEISYRLRSHTGSTGGFTSDLSPLSGTGTWSTSTR